MILGNKRYNSRVVYCAGSGSHTPSPAVRPPTRKELRGFFHSDALQHELTDDVDETPLDDEDFDLDDEGDDTDYDDEDYEDDEDSSDEDEDQDDDSEAQTVQEDDGPAPELRDYYLDVSLEENGDGSKRSPFNNPASLKGVRLAPGATLFVRSRTVVENLEIAGHGTLEEPITLAPYGHGPVPRFVMGDSAPMVARDYLAQNGYIFRGWVIKGIKMQPSIAALTGELERMRREEAERAASKRSGKRSKSQDKDGSFTVSDSDEGDEPAQRVVTAGATADPVKDYLKQIGKVALLNAEQEVELAKRIEAGLYAEHRLAEEGNDLPAKLRRELHWVAQDGQRAKNHLLEANLRLVVSLAKRYTGRGMLFLDLIQEATWASSAPWRSSTTPRASSSPPTPPGGFARPLPARWLTRPVPSAFRCTWSRSSTSSPAYSARCFRTWDVSPPRRSWPSSWT